jgi:allophanate hydrolase
VSIFALTAEDGERVLKVAEGYDALDDYSRPVDNVSLGARRIGVPRADQLEFFGDGEYQRLYESAIQKCRSQGLMVQEIDVASLLETGQLLYQGPWIAERYAAIEEFIRVHADALHPITRALIEGARSLSATDAFKGQYRLMALKRRSEAVWQRCDVLLMPTAGTIFKIADMEADPIALNSKLGFYTNFVNFLDLAAVATPAGFRADGLPFGVTLIGRRSTDFDLLKLAASLHPSLVSTVGALDWPLPPAPVPKPGAPAVLALAVCGAHMDGLPLNRELRDRGGLLLRKARTSPRYRLYALPGGPPQRPGLVRTGAGGASIDVEVWGLAPAEFGAFVSNIRAPLGVGKIELDDGDLVSGFLCETYAIEKAADITAFGSWRAYLSR